MLQSTGPERSELEAAETKEEVSGHQSWLTGKSIGVICLTDCHNTIGNHGDEEAFSNNVYAR